MTTAVDVESKLPPQNLEAERALLGAILLENTVMSKAMEIITEEDFYKTAHRKIYLSMLDLSGRGKVIDQITLTEHMKTKGELESVGGAAYLAELFQVTPSSANIRHHAAIVRDKSVERALIVVSDAIVKRLYDGRDVADLIIRLRTIEQRKTRADGTIQKSNSLATAVLSYEKLTTATIPSRTYFMPWLCGSSINMVYGRRGVGKTMFGAGVGASLCTGTQLLKWPVSNPVGVLYVDGEMPMDELRHRFTSLLPKPPVAPLLFLTGEHVYHSLERDLVLSAENMRQQVVEILDQHSDVKVLILDNISCLFSGIDEDSKSDWEPISAWLVRLRHRGIATILMHHAGKGGQQRGTSGREDTLDCTIELAHGTDYDARKGCRFELRFTKSRAIRGDAVAPLEVWLTEQHRLESKPLEQSKEDRAKALFDDGVTSPSDLAEELGITRGYASKLLKKLRANVSS